MEFSSLFVFILFFNSLLIILKTNPMHTKKLQKIKNMTEKREQQKMLQKIHQATTTTKKLKYKITKTVSPSQTILKDISKSHVVIVFNEFIIILIYFLLMNILCSLMIKRYTFSIFYILATRSRAISKVSLPLVLVLECNNYYLAYYIKRYFLD